jgi:hypothetical protein
MTKADDIQPDGYEGYARFCLALAAKAPDRRNRLVLREMAAAWLNLADGSAPPRQAGE